MVANYNSKNIFFIFRFFLEIVRISMSKKIFSNNFGNGLGKERKIIRRKNEWMIPIQNIIKFEGRVGKI